MKRRKNAEEAGYGQVTHCCRVTGVVGEQDVGQHRFIQGGGVGEVCRRRVSEETHCGKVRGWGEE